MKISYNWIKETVDVPVDARALAHELTMVGLQLESLEPHGDDAVLDFEITVNRPDCLSLIGICREVAAVFRMPAPPLPPIHPIDVLHIDGLEGRMMAGEIPLRVVLEDPVLCPRYCAQILTNIRIGPSPEWMRKKLEASDIRSINNVVDITNFVMLELGQPLHAFDYMKIAEGTIRVRQARNEDLPMLDERTRKLTAPMLAIADANRAVAVGGVMGGKESEVTDSTTTVLMESAYFLPSSVRKTAKALEVSTDASYRFERGVDYKLQPIAIRRAAALLQEYAGATVFPVLDVTAKLPSPISIRLRPERSERVLGMKMDSHFIDNTLTSLGFLKRSEREWEVPSFRVDVTKEIDLIEEVARIYGYNNFPNTLPSAERKYQPDYPSLELEKRLSELLRAARFDEAYSFSLVNPGSPFQPQEQRIRVVNPVSETASELRTSTIPGLLESIEFNLRHRNEQVRLFEMGHIFPREGERTALGIVMTGEYRELKGVVESVFAALQYDSPIFSETEVRVNGEIAGKWQHTELEGHPVECCEIYLDKLLRLPTRELKYHPIIPYPFVERDVSLILDEKIAYAELAKVFADLKIPELRSFKLLDRYKGKNTPSGKVSVTFKLIFQLENRTLTSEEVDVLYQKIVNHFASVFSASLR